MQSMARRRIIVDTDPGVDDILALLLAFAAEPDELEVVLVSVTHGNVDVQSCLRNVLALFHTISRENAWRESQGLEAGFVGLTASKPIVAVGAEAPLADQKALADFFHGEDGLGGISTSHPHLSPTDTWADALDSLETATENSKAALAFTPSRLPAYKEILRTLASNPPDTITIVAIGPLTNIALAAASDPMTFLRVKELVIMGGALAVPGNISPLAEFNTHGDAYAAARVLALTSPTPSSTMPPPADSRADARPHAPENGEPDTSSPYLSPLPRRLRATLFPLDITTAHVLRGAAFAAIADPLRRAGSPLAEWTAVFLAPLFDRSKRNGEPHLSLHDPLTVWYAMTSGGSAEDECGAWILQRERDVRVETLGQWSRGVCVTDGRTYGPRRKEPMPGDHGDWRSEDKGNRIAVAVTSPGDGETSFAGEMLQRIFAALPIQP